MEKSTFNPTRRTVLKMAWGAVTVMVTPVAAFGWQCKGESVAGASGNNSWSGPSGQARHRIDGLAKVLGRKVYARDFRARDMPGWPEQEKVGMVLHATHVDRQLWKVDLSMLPEHLQPVKIVDADQLAKDNIQSLYPDTSPASRPNGFMAAIGERPVYFGQPIAILIFANAEVHRQAYRILQFNNDVVQYGPPEPLPPFDGPYPPPTYLTFAGGKLAGEEFSQTLDGHSDPNQLTVKPKDTTPASIAQAKHQERTNRQAKRTRDLIQAAIERSNWKQVRVRRSTQCIVPMFMEPESGLAWLDRETLHLVIGTQAPNGDVQSGLSLFEKARPQVSEVCLVSCYPGGGFGGRDVSPFTPTLILAAYYTDGPVRLAYDRFAQFQAGLTQLPAQVEQSIAVDSRGIFQALQTKTVMPSGGKNNYSQFVAELAAYSAGGAYRFPQAIIDATATPTTALVCGSMRGFGGVQAAFAIETAVEEVARQLKMDPIELRRRNVLKQHDQTVTGAPLVEPMRFVEICDKAAANPLWQNRAAEKQKQSSPDQLYGVGFAIANQAYGTGNDGVMANVLLEPDGSLAVRTTAVDMGQGSATTLALAPSQWLGSNASSIDMGRVNLFLENLQFDVNEQYSHHKKHLRDQGEPTWENPNYTRSFSMSSSACITAFQQFHAVDQAAQVLFRTGIVPAARQLWQKQVGRQPNVETLSDQNWQDGELRAPGFPGLKLAEIAQAIEELGGVTETMVHAYFAGRWVEANYQVGNVRGRWQIDGLSTRRAGQEEYIWHERTQTLAPPKNSKNYGRSLYSPSGTIAAVLVHPKSGQVEVQDIYTFLDAGKVHQPDLVSGQYQGGVAMGVGYALLEDSTRDETGPGNGRWNLNRYHVALAGDLPLHRIKLELLPPLGENPTGKGIAESVLCPIAPAIANAITDATGHAFADLPITPAKIREALNP